MRNVQDPRPLATLIRTIEPLRPNDPLALAVRRIAEIGGLPVADGDGRVVGYLSEGDALRALVPGYLRELRHTGFLTRDFPALLRFARRSAAEPVSEHMTRDVEVLDADDSESHAAEVFLHLGVRALPVVDAEGRLLGVVRIADLTARLVEQAVEAGATS